MPLCRAAQEFAVQMVQTMHYWTSPLAMINAVISAFTAPSSSTPANVISPRDDESKVRHDR